LPELEIDTNRVLDELATLLATELGGYISEVPGLAQITGIHMSSDYRASGREKPYVAVFPTEAQIIDGGQCVVNKRLVVDVSVFIGGPDEEKNSRDMVSYADCLESFFLHHRETESLFDIEIQGVEYFSRASSIEKMASIMIECTTRSSGW